MMLLVLTLDYEPSTDDVLTLLTNAGVKWVRLNMNKFLTTATCTIHIDDDNEGFDLQSYGKQCDIATISAVWFRKFSQDTNLPIPLTNAEVFYVRRELEHFWRGLFAQLSSKPWINPFATSRITKPEQLYIAKKVGLKIPSTLISNDFQRVKEFFYRHNDNCVVKPVSHGMIYDFVEDQHMQVEPSRSKRGEEDDSPSFTIELSRKSCGRPVAAF